MRDINCRAWEKGKMWYSCNIRTPDQLKAFFGMISFPRTLMWSTGLQDKNGKDIYEGDIVENYAFRDVVIFDKGIFTTKRSTLDKFGVKQPLSIHKELEVIGNIHENPELLGVSDA